MKRDIEDLNLSRISADGDSPSLLGLNPSCEEGDVRVVFRDLETRLIACIGDADVVVGCVAWLTSARILRALAGKKAVALVVQKEDFLRPDLDRQSGDWKNRLRALYNNLPLGLSRLDDAIPEPLNSMSCSSSDLIDAVRCVGNHNSDKRPAFPRMHNKFIVFCRSTRVHRKTEYWEGDADVLQPYAIWTGSFNFTLNAAMSLENALYITRSAIVQAYFQEWANIEAISEHLDWTSEWMEPEWRIGT